MASQSAALCRSPAFSPARPSTRTECLWLSTKRGRQKLRGQLQGFLVLGRESIPHHAAGSARFRSHLPVRAQQVEFKARRAVTISCQEGVLPPEEYLKEVERVVKITFPDSSRMKYMGHNLYRVQILPITFFSLTATPLCDIKVYYEDPSVRIYSDKLVLEGSSLIRDMKKLDFRFNLKGDLKAVREKGSRADKTGFSGAVSLQLGLDLPLPFSLMPEPLVTSVGDDLLDRILAVLESQLLRGISRDYMAWCKQQAVASQRMLPRESR